MKYPSAPCDKTCTLDEAHNDDYNPMYDPLGTFLERTCSILALDDSEQWRSAHRPRLLGDDPTMRSMHPLADAWRLQIIRSAR